MVARKRGFFAEIEHQRLMREREAKRVQAEQERRETQARVEQERAARAQQRADAQAAREQRELHISEQTRQATEMTQALESRVAELNAVLVDGLASPSLSSFDQLRLPNHPEPFAPSRDLLTARPEPLWEDFAPQPARGLGKLFKGILSRATAEADTRFEQAVATWQSEEGRRLADLAAAKGEHEARESARLEDVERHNAQVDQLQQRVLAATPEAVDEYFEAVLEASPLPDDLPVDAEVACQPDSRTLRIIRELPQVEIIPEAREFTYVRSRDEITIKTRPLKEIRQRYAALVAQLALRTMRDAFEVQPHELVDVVEISGEVSTRNKATGRSERPCLVSVSATRTQFQDLVLTELDPAECLRHLNAVISPHPWDLEAVRPIFDPDLSKYRFIDAHDAASGLDSRPVLLEMHPSNFEQLVRQLFEAMGMKAWVTQASRDDGVDGVAVNDTPYMAGICVIQAKRYSGIVPADAVRALAGVMDDKKAMTGVLVTTSWFGKASHDFARRQGRIQLIQGEELKYLIAEHLHKDVIIGDLKGKS